jgi:ATP-dependent Clp protease adaptor protein ClpS
MNQPDIQLDEKIDIEITEPLKYKVVFVNDDQTPMEFVIEVLIGIYKHSASVAENLTLTIHSEGSGIAGIYNYEIAEQKSIETVNLARANGFPLTIRVEADE